VVHVDILTCTLPQVSQVVICSEDLVLSSHNVLLLFRQSLLAFAHEVGGEYWGNPQEH